MSSLRSISPLTFVCVVTPLGSHTAYRNTQRAALCQHQHFYKGVCLGVPRTLNTLTAIVP